MIGNEIMDWLPRVTARLIDLAIQKLPYEYFDLFSEKWRAEVAETPGQLSKFFVALKCCLAAMRIDARSKPSVARSRHSFGYGAVVAVLVAVIVPNELSNANDGAYAFEAVLTVLGIAGAKMHTDNPDWNFVGRPVEELGAGAAFPSAPATGGHRQSKTARRANGHIASFGAIGGF
jgi:hypothetical protein